MLEYRFFLVNLHCSFKTTIIKGNLILKKIWIDEKSKIELIISLRVLVNLLTDSS